MNLFYLALWFIVGFIVGHQTAKSRKPKQIPGDYDGDGVPFTDQDLGAFQSQRNRLRGKRNKGKSA